MNIHTPSVPPVLRITETMICDVLCDPVLGARILLGEELDAFQRVRLKVSWWSPRCIDSSGFSSEKTGNMVRKALLRSLLFDGQVSAIYYPSFDAAKRIFMPPFLRIAMQSPILRAQLGRQRILGVDGKSHEEEKALKKGPACYVIDFKNGSQILLPAPGFLQDAKTQAGQRFHDLYIDEWTKIMALGSKSNDTKNPHTGIESQLLGRSTLASWNKEHPLYCNHHLFLATAEDTMHPAYHRYMVFQREVKAGNPDYALISFSYKDYSDKQARNGLTFRQFRNDKVIEDIRKANTSRSHFLQEALGIWSKNGRGFYTGESIARCYALGERMGAQVYCSRAEDPEAENALYFAGVDPARAETKKADDGAIVVLRAVPLAGITNDPHGYKLSFCYAYKVRGADAPQWSGIIHKKHRHFHFAGIMMDPLGGGAWIQPELRKTEQVIEGIRITVRPIATLEEEADIQTAADFILTIFRPKDLQVNKTWGNMSMLKMENLIDNAHVEFRDGLNMGIGFPKYVKQLPRDQTAGWSKEKFYASVLISDPKIGIGAQCMAISVATNDDGTVFLSKPSGARMFSSRIRKDFCYAAMYAYARFKVWLANNEGDLRELKDEDAVLCWGSERGRR